MRALILGLLEIKSKRVFTVLSSKKIELDVELLASVELLMVFPITMQAFQLTFGLLFLSALWTTIFTLPLMF